MGKFMSKVLIFLIILISGAGHAQSPITFLSKTIDSLRRPLQKVGIPLIADMDNDGQKEVITAVLDYKGTLNPPLLLYIIKNDGSIFTNFPKGYNELLFDFACGDVDGDGFKDIVLRFTYSIDVIDRFGNSLPGFPVSYNENEYVLPRFVSLYDLDNDGKLEIITSRFGEVTTFNFDGTTKSGWPRNIAGRAQYNPAIGDIDGDGFGELIFTSFKFVNQIIDSASVIIFKSNGELFSTDWPKYFPKPLLSWSSSPSLYINKNYPDSTFFTIVLDSAVSTGQTYTSHRLLKFNSNGNILSSRSYFASHDFGTLVMGDINKNGNIEFATGTQQHLSNLSAFNSNLERFSGWPQPGGGEHYATVAIGKLTFGNNLNILSNSWDAKPIGFGKIYAYNLEGDQLPWSPLRPWGIVKAISLADLNNDGSVELISVTSQTNAEFNLNIWTFPGIPFIHEDFPWPQYGHDRYRTNQYGFIPPDEPVGIQPMNTNVPDRFSLHQNFPNPFNPATSIKFDIAKKGNVKLVVFDMLGRELSTLIDESLNPGTYQVSFDARLHGQGSGLSSGIYFCCLQSEDYVYTMKMNLIK